MKFLFFLLFCSILNAANVKLVWNPNPSAEEVTKYTIYYGSASGQLTNSHSVSSPNPLSVPTTLTVTNLSVGQTYYFAVSASNITGESGLSAEISVTVTDKPVTPPSGPIPNTNWVVSVTSEETIQEDNKKGNATDGNTQTFWHSQWNGTTLPQAFTVDLGNLESINAISYLPRQDGERNGSIRRYSVQISIDGTIWTDIVSGEFSFSPVEKTVTFATVEAKYVRLVALSDYSTSGSGWAAIAEFKVIGVINQNLPSPTGPIGVSLEIIE